MQHRCTLFLVVSFAAFCSSSVTMNRKGDVLVHSLLDGNVILSSGRGDVVVEHESGRINLLRALQVAEKVAGQMCFISPNNPLPQWGQLPAMPVPAWGLTAAAIDNIIYVVGGTDGATSLNTLRAFNIEERTWTVLSPMANARAFPFLGVSEDDGLLYVFGGYDVTTGAPVTEVEFYDTREEGWDPLPLQNMPFPHKQGVSAQIGDVVYFIGGVNGQNVTRFNLLQKQWKVDGMPAIPYPRYNAGAVAIEEKIYVIGGHDTINKTAKIELLNTFDAQWNPRSEFGLPKEQVGFATLQGLIFGIGGITHEVGSDADVNVLNERTGTWKVGLVVNDLEAARDSFATVVVDDVIYIMGGKYQADRSDIKTPLDSVEYTKPCF